MKKHDEGYVLAFVMVVIVVLCLVAVSLMSISLNNMEAQSASVQRMQDKYAAMGTVEQVVAILNTTAGTATGKGDADEAIASILSGQSGVSVRVTSKPGAGDAFSGFEADVTISAQSNDIQIVCGLSWNGTLSKENGIYAVTTTECKYTSYQISAVGTGEEVVE